MTEPIKPLFAVASNDGRIINQHFGHAERFLIYTWENEKVRFVEERRIERYCLPEDQDDHNDDHNFMEERFKNIVNTVKDCKYLLISRIGVIPEEKLKETGIIPLIMYDLIETGIAKTAEKYYDG